MIRIVTPGRPPQETPMRGQCNYCHCTIECVKGDARSVEGRYNETLYRVKCPQKSCLHDIYVEEVKE